MELTASHWMYLAGTILIILTMLFRQNVVVPALLMTFLVGFLYGDSLVFAFQTVFNASLTAAGELFNIFLIIAIMTALLHMLKTLGADEAMITPFRKVMVNGHISFWVIAVVTYFISLFFWPTPAVPLVGSLLLPVAIRAGLPPIGAALAIALAGQGMALSSDYIIQIAPTLTATSASANVTLLADRGLVLSVVTGIIALVLAYTSNLRSIQKPSIEHLKKWEQGEELPSHSTKGRFSLLFAILVPLSFFIVVIYMGMAKFLDGFPSLEGGSGAALIGGVALMLLIIGSLFHYPKQFLQDVSDHIVKGFVFAFKAMGPVIPIAGFFFIGSGEMASKILGTSPEETPSFLFELILAGQQLIPENAVIAAFSILIIGMITGLDGSGFSGLPLVGALSGALAPTVGLDAETLGAIGQMGAIWVGGGTLIAWSSLVAVSGFARVPVMDLVRKSLLPVLIGLFASTIVALLIFS